MDVLGRKHGKWDVKTGPYGSHTKRMLSSFQLGDVGRSLVWTHSDDAATD